MVPDPFAFADLLRGTGKSATAIARAFNETRPQRLLSSPTVEAWMRVPAASRAPGRPRWDMLAGLAGALRLPLDRVLRAYAGRGEPQKLEAPEDELLWQAFPSGAFPVRGVLTVGGWQCVYDSLAERASDVRAGLDATAELYHAIWRYSTGWEITQHLDADAAPRWTNRTGADMGSQPETFARNGDLLPDLTDPLTRFAVEQFAPAEAVRLLRLG